MTSVFFGSGGQRIFELFRVEKNMISTHANDLCEKGALVSPYFELKHFWQIFNKHVCCHTAGSQNIKLFFNICSTFISSLEPNLAKSFSE
jgi:hypothetical protein